MKQMKIRLIERKYKSISARNWARIPKFALPVLGSHDLTSFQCNFGVDTTRRSAKNAWDQFIKGSLR